MVALWGGLVWIGLALLKRTHNPQPQTPTSVPTEATSVAAPPRPSAQEILAERLARGEIEPDDYRMRIEALRPPPSP
jgi:hypothetical protein